MIIVIDSFCTSSLYTRLGLSATVSRISKMTGGTSDGHDETI
ncbi:MAG: hypothetical protein UHN88_07505 [Eubacterium sp.]|nr:hypothetical protein [Eubacterium sp.]